MTCALCGDEGMLRVAGLSLCEPCTTRDPAPALEAQGFAVEWATGLGRFQAGVGIPGAREGFHLKCTPERVLHAVAKWFSDELEVGDPAFDDQVYVRTSDRDVAGTLLAREGVQAALLTLLADARPNELAGNAVTLSGPTLAVGVRPTAPLDVVAFQLATAALALHIRDAA